MAPRKKTLSTVKELQDEALRLIGEGKLVKEAMASIGRSEETYRSWRKQNINGFADKLKAIRSGTTPEPEEKLEVPDFPEFCAEVFKPLPLHHLRTWDVVNNQEPRDWHPSLQLDWGTGKFQNGDDGDDVRHIILNFPPEHAKSTVWTVQYVVWKLTKDPNHRVAIVCETEDLARKFLGQIQRYFASPDLYPELHKYAPEGGWRPVDKGEGLPWRANAIRLQNNTSEQKDANVEAFGMTSKIYGTRFDTMILDDITSYRSAGNYKSQSEIIGQDIYTRVDKSHGTIMLVGTRVGPMDVYRFLREKARDMDENPLYTYFSQPAILENEHESYPQWVTLWPERFTPRRLSSAKAGFAGNRVRWAYVYQQKDIPEEAVFHPVAVDTSVLASRFHGRMEGTSPGIRPQGMAGLWVICSWDPASSAGSNAMIAYAIDPATSKRYVLDAWIQSGVLPRQSKAKFKEWTDKYKPNEWVIEKNGVQQYITADPELTDYARERGVVVIPHETRQNKYDADYGVEARLVPLFYSCVEFVNEKEVQPLADRSKHLIELPNKTKNKDIGKLVEQLKLWEPNATKLVQDGVMALWFAEMRAFKRVRKDRPTPTHANTRFSSRKAVKSRGVFHRGSRW